MSSFYTFKTTIFVLSLARLHACSTCSIFASGHFSELFQVTIAQFVCNIQRAVLNLFRQLETQTHQATRELNATQFWPSSSGTCTLRFLQITYVDRSFLAATFSRCQWKEREFHRLLGRVNGGGSKRRTIDCLTEGGRSIFRRRRCWKRGTPEQSAEMYQDEYRMECYEHRIFGFGYDLELFADWFLFSLECSRAIFAERASILKTDTREIATGVRVIDSSLQLHSTRVFSNRWMFSHRCAHAMYP